MEKAVAVGSWTESRQVDGRRIVGVGSGGKDEGQRARSESRARGDFD